MPWSNYTHKRSPLTKEESNRLVNSCRTLKEKIVIWILLDTGLRISELCNLNVADIDWQGAKLTIYGKGRSKGPKSKPNQKKRRMVPLTHRVKILLEHHFATINSEDGSPMTIGGTLRLTNRSAEQIVKRVANRAMIGAKSICPHVLRHTFAVTSLENGVSLPALQAVLGHEDIETTAIYLNLSNDEAVRIFQERGYK